MKQLSDDIVLVEGNNELNVALVPILLPPDIRLSNLTSRWIVTDGSQILVSVTATNYGGLGSSTIKWMQGADPSWPPYRYYYPGHPDADAEGYITINYWENAIEIKTIELGQGESKTVSFVFRPTMPGKYTIYVANAPGASNGLWVELTSSKGQVPIETIIPSEEVLEALADP